MTSFKLFSYLEPLVAIIREIYKIKLANLVFAKKLGENIVYSHK